MSKRISQFRFKQFAVSHHRSAMKVGVDGVLIGCWADVKGARCILDVGTGCGLIALIMAQRCPEACVTGIDIDYDSVVEATENADNSNWKDRISIVHGDFPLALNQTRSDKRYDLIVSNPPYFDSGLTDIVTSRERARHQGRLSPSSLLRYSKAFLNIDGKIAIVVPADISSALEKEAFDLGYLLIKKCLVRGHEGAPFKRALLQWKLSSDTSSEDVSNIEYLTLEESLNTPTDEYRNLCKDFYLKF